MNSWGESFPEEKRQSTLSLSEKLHTSARTNKETPGKRSIRRQCIIRLYIAAKWECIVKNYTEALCLLNTLLTADIYSNHHCDPVVHSNLVIPHLPDHRDSKGLDTPQPANSGEDFLLGKKQMIPMLSSQHCQRFPGRSPLYLWVQGQFNNNKQQWLFTTAPIANYQYQRALHCQYPRLYPALCSWLFVQISHSYSSYSQCCSICPVIFPTHHVNKVTSDLRDESHVPMGGDKWGRDRIYVTALYPSPSSFSNRTQKSPDASIAKW